MRARAKRVPMCTRFWLVACVGAAVYLFLKARNLQVHSSTTRGPMRKASIINVRAAVAVVALAAGCTVQRPEPNLAGQDVHLTVVHTADIHSRFFPYYFAPGQVDKGLGLIPKTGQNFAVVGGIGRVSTVVKCIR